jgi:hypothetical protein
MVDRIPELTREEQVEIARDTDFWTAQTSRLLLAMRKANLPVKIVSKADGYKVWWHRLAIGFLMLLFPKKLEQQFRDNYITTLGKYVYWSAKDPFDAGSMGDFSTLYHECVHILQQRRFLTIPYFLLYTVLPLPLLFTGRGLIFERRAYKESARVFMSAGQTRIVDRSLDGYAEQFSSGMYLWMDPVWSGGFKKGSSLRKQVADRKLLAKGGYLEKIGFELEYHPMVLEKAGQKGVL